VKRALADLNRDRSLYYLLIAPVAFMILFKFVPLLWITMAFKEYNIFRGLNESPWVGLLHFRRLFSTEEFYQVFRNTLLINVYRIAFLFPAPIIIALLLNEVTNIGFKRVVQTIIYVPHFLSWVVVAALFIQILSVDGGLVNQIIASAGLRPVPFLMDKRFFRGILVFTAGWKDVGWNTIIYLAAITAIDPQLYEAAMVEGANRLQRTWHITLPGIASTIVVLLLLRLGQILGSNIDQVLMLYNPLVYEVGDVLATYVYRMGLGKMEYSFGTAVGLFNSVIGFILVISANALTRRISDRSIW
jgi:putative aldouronate transport system permease protein